MTQYGRYLLPAGLDLNMWALIQACVSYCLVLTRVSLLSGHNCGFLSDSRRIVFRGDHLVPTSPNISITLSRYPPIPSTGSPQISPPSIFPISFSDFWLFSLIVLLLAPSLCCCYSLMSLSRPSTVLSPTHLPRSDMFVIPVLALIRSSRSSTRICIL